MVDRRAVDASRRSIAHLPLLLKVSNVAIFAI
jgi:hypothetical protein